MAFSQENALKLISEQTLFRLHRATQSIWVRPVFYVLGATLAVLLGPFLDPYVPDDLYRILREDALSDILTILASSMLSVAIFSLGTMVAAYRVGAESATPRARPLITRDRTAQNAISAFIGAFLFSLLGLTGLSVGLFSDGGRFILFLFSIVLLVLVLATFIGWMQRLANLGGVPEVINQVEHATNKAFAQWTRSENPLGRPVAKLPGRGAKLTPEKEGYVQHVDAGQLTACAEQSGQTLTICVLPGAFVHTERPLVISPRGLDDKIAIKVRSAFVIGDQRTFDADPRYGLVVLSEIAARALSPAVNDPGTALDVIGTQTRIINTWQRQKREAEPAPEMAGLQVLAMDMNGLVADAFMSAIRHGSANYDVALQIRRSLGLIAETADPDLARAAGALRDEAYRYAESMLPMPGDKKRLLDEGRQLYPLDPAR